MKECIIRVLFAIIHFFSRPHDYVTVLAAGETEVQLEGNINSRLRQRSNVMYTCCVVEYHKLSIVC